MAELTLRVQKFIEGYAKHGNASQAAKDAGYSPKSAAAQASRLLKKANVKAEIDRLKALAESNTIASMEEAQQRLTMIMRASPSDFLNDDLTLNMEAIKASGYAIQSLDLLKGKITLRCPIAAIRELGDISNWEKAPTQRISFDFNLKGDKGDK